MPRSRQDARRINEEKRPWMLPLVERLRFLREERGLTQAEVARRSGIQRVNICRIESGQYCPSIGSVLRVCDALGVLPSEVFGVLDQQLPPHRKDP